MLVTAGNLEYKELSVLNKGGELNSPPSTSNSNGDNNVTDDKSIVLDGDVVEIFKKDDINQNDNTEAKVKNIRKEQQKVKYFQEKELSKDDPLMKNLEKLNKIIKSLENTELKFEKDKVTKRNLIKILDKKTKKVIRQIPPEDFYKFIVELYKMNQKNDKLNNEAGDNYKGLFVNENI